MCSGTGPELGMRATNGAYEISHLAVVLLVQKTSLEKVVMEYWKGRAGRGLFDRWEATFMKVFGVSLDDFYASFDRNVRGKN
jgi:hypothetical protein